MGLLQQLQISKPNKSIDVFFRTEDAADFFVKKHIEIRGKPIPFIRKPKRILRIMVKGVDPEISDDMLLYKLEPFNEHCSSVKHNEIHHRGTTFRDGTRQTFVTHLARHIPRSIKIGNRWCLVLQRPAWPAWKASPTNTGYHNNTPCRRTLWPNGCRRARARHQCLWGIIWRDLRRLWDIPSDRSRWAMPEASHTSKRVREPEEIEQSDKKSSE